MATFSRIKEWVAEEILTASDLNAEFDNIVDNMTPTGLEDASSDVTAMQANTDPGGVGTESLATTLLGEIQRLRYVIKRIVGGAQWYSTPTYNLSAPPALNEVISSSSGAFSSTTTYAYQDVTNLSVSITTTGRRVRVVLVSDGSSNNSFTAIDTNTQVGTIKSVRGSTDLGVYPLFKNNQSTIGNYEWTDKPSAGSYTYKVQVQPYSDGTRTVTVNYLKLLVYEL